MGFLYALDWIVFLGITSIVKIGLRVLHTVGSLRDLVTSLYFGVFDSYSCDCLHKKIWCILSSYHRNLSHSDRSPCVFGCCVSSCWCRNLWERLGCLLEESYSCVTLVISWLSEETSYNNWTLEEHLLVFHFLSFFLYFYSVSTLSIELMV